MFAGTCRGGPWNERRFTGERVREEIVILSRPGEPRYGAYVWNKDHWVWNAPGLPRAPT